MRYYSVLPFVFELASAELGLLRHWIGLFALAIAAFLAGLWISVFREPRPSAIEDHRPTPIAPRTVPEANRFLTTFQGTLRRKPDSREHWVAAQIQNVAVASDSVYTFTYVLVLPDGTERGEGMISVKDGTVHMGTLKGEARLLPDGAIQMGSRFGGELPSWHFRSLPPRAEGEEGR